MLNKHFTRIKHLHKYKIECMLKEKTIVHAKITSNTEYEVECITINNSAHKIEIAISIRQGAPKCYNIIKRAHCWVRFFEFKCPYVDINSNNLVANHEGTKEDCNDKRRYGSRL